MCFLSRSAIRSWPTGWIEIRVVEPEDTSELGIQTGEDLCTLVTCTPYGINSQRLLVRGRRTEYVDHMEEKISPLDSSKTQWMEQYRRSVVIGVAILAGILLLYWIWDSTVQKWKKKRQRVGEKRHE